MAAGSEGGPDSVITKGEGMLKRGSHNGELCPPFSILNPVLTQTLPVCQTACDVTDGVIEGLLSTMIYEVPKVMADPDDYQARANIMWTGMMAHTAGYRNGRDGYIEGFVSLGEGDVKVIYHLMI